MHSCDAKTKYLVDDTEAEVDESNNNIDYYCPGKSRMSSC